MVVASNGMGINMQLTIYKIHIENERLKMDRRRAEAFDPDCEVIIKIEGVSESEVQDWAG